MSRFPWDVTPYHWTWRSFHFPLDPLSLHSSPTSLLYSHEVAFTDGSHLCASRQARELSCDACSLALLGGWLLPPISFRIHTPTQSFYHQPHPTRLESSFHSFSFPPEYHRLSFLGMPFDMVGFCLPFLFTPCIPFFSYSPELFFTYCNPITSCPMIDPIANF